MTTFVPINTSQRLGGQLRAAIDQLQAAKQAMTKLKAIMDTQISGSDYALLESQFGLQTGQGQTCYNLLAGSSADLAASVNVTELLSWCG